MSLSFTGSRERLWRMVDRQLHKLERRSQFGSQASDVQSACSAGVR